MFTSHFTFAQFDTLHVHAAMPYQNTKLNLPNAKYNSAENSYYPISWFYMDETKQYKAFVVMKERNLNKCKSVYLFVFQVDNDSLLIEYEIASHCILESTYEEKMNAWIADFNNDGVLEIGIFKRLIDFEWPTENLDNISSDKEYLLIFKNGQFVHQVWHFDVLKKYPLLPLD